MSFALATNTSDGLGRQQHAQLVELGEASQSPIRLGRLRCYRPADAPARSRVVVLSSRLHARLASFSSRRRSDPPIYYGERRSADHSTIRSTKT